MTSTRTPNTMYVIEQGWPGLDWRVVPVDAAQGQALRLRRVPHVYDTSAQAHAVKDRLNKERRDGAHSE